VRGTPAHFMSAAVVSAAVVSAAVVSHRPASWQSRGIRGRAGYRRNDFSRR
jgi:hypothetical protein